MSKTGRNDPCPCGSGRKFKQCCGGSNPTVKGTRGAPPAERLQALVREARRLVQAGRHAEALVPLAQASQLLPDSAELLNDLGTTCLLAGRVPRAIECLQRSAALKPTLAATHYNLGLALTEARQLDAAIDAYRRATRLAPDLVAAHARVADLSMRLGRQDDALAACEQAFAAAPSSPVGRLYRAKALMLRGRAAEAERILGELAQSDPTGEASLAHGVLLSEMGRFDEAAVSFERCLASAPGQSAAYHGLVSCRRMTETDRPIVDRILSQLQAPHVTDEHRMMLHFAAGKALDDLQDYARAMEQFDAANRIRRRMAPPVDHGRFAALVDRVVARFTPALFAQHAGLGDRDETPVFVLGMPRSGTTLVERIVASHPRAAGGGEIPYWNDRAPAVVEAPIDQVARTAEALRGDYLRVLRELGPDAARVTDKMPFNFLWIGLIHLLLPRARFIHCRRCPLDTCLSIYTVKFTQLWGFASDRGDLAAYYRQYLRLMEHWRAVIPRDRLVEVDYEEATASPEAVARRLVAFCGLPWDAACAQPERNPIAIRTASRWQARQPVYKTSVERWRRYEAWLGELRGLVEEEPSERLLA
jgi:tetratricopeptide (TPR) repeat protein